MVEDAIGELCNMIAGGWKSKLDTTQSVCLISVPIISREDSTTLKNSLHTATTLRRTYAFQNNVFGIVLGL